MASCLRRTGWQITIIIFFLLILALFPLALVLGVPIFIIRKIVSYSSKIFRPDLGKMLSTRSTVFATDDIYNFPKATLVVFLAAELSFNSFEEMDVSELLERYRLRLGETINAKTPDGKLEHPELQQYISSWMGFYFWKYDKSFDMANHVSVYDGKVKFEYLDEESIIQVSQELVSKPFTKGRSPWEFIGFPYVKFKGPNCQTTRPQGAVAFRLHHALADGYSIAKLIVADIAAQKIELVKPSPIRKSWLNRMCTNTTFVLKAPYEFVSQLANSYDCNSWHVAENKISPKINFGFTDKIPIKYIKEIKKKNDVSFTAVIFATFAGALRNFMIQNGVKVPESIHCVAPFPVPGHPDKLRNYMTAIFVELAVGIADPDKRLHTIEKHIKSLKTSTVPYMQFLLFPLMGGLFPWMSKYLFKQYYSTAILSSFPGPPKLIEFDGHTAIDVFFIGGMLPGRIGISLCSLSYGDFIRIGAGFNEGVIPSTVPVSSFIGKITEELQILYNNGKIENIV